MKQIDGTALLVTIAEDLSNEPTLKVWALDQTEKKTGGPKCLSSLDIHNGRKQFPVILFIHWTGKIVTHSHRYLPLMLSKIFPSWPLDLLTVP